MHRFIVQQEFTNSGKLPGHNHFITITYVQSHIPSRFLCNMNSEFQLFTCRWSQRGWNNYHCGKFPELCFCCAAFWCLISFQTHGAMSQTSLWGLYFIISPAPEATYPQQCSLLHFLLMESSFYSDCPGSPDVQKLVKYGPYLTHVLSVSVSKHHVWWQSATICPT